MRFAVEGQLPQTFMAFVDSRLKANSFRESRHTTEEKRLGWVSAMDILDTDFNKDDYSLGDYLVFSLRADHKMIPPKLFKVRLMEEQRRFMAEHGGRFIRTSAGSVDGPARVVHCPGGADVPYDALLLAQWWPILMLTARNALLLVLFAVGIRAIVRVPAVHTPRSVPNVPSAPAGP